MKQSSRLKRQEDIKTLGGFDGGPGPTEETKMSILVSLIEDLEDSINGNSDKNDKLSKAMIRLTFVIGVGTLILALIGGTDLWLKFKAIQQYNKPPEVSTNLAK